MQLVGAGHPRSIGVIHDLPVGHEQADDVGQLVRVAEVDRVRGALDDDEQGVVDRLPGDLAQPFAARHERVAVADDRQRRDPEGEEPVEGGVLGQGPEQPQRARHPEPQVIRYRDGDQARGLPGTVADQLAHGAVQRLVVQPSRRRHEHRALQPLGVQMRELRDDGAAHRVPDQRGGDDAAVVEEGGCRVGQVGDVERPQRVAAASEPGQVGHVGVELGGQPLGRRDQVRAGHPEAVQVQHHPAVERIRRLPVEDLHPVERGPVLGQDRRRAGEPSSSSRTCSPPRHSASMVRIAGVGSGGPRTGVSG